MARVFNFFLIGLVAGCAFLFLYHRNRQLESQVKSLSELFPARVLASGQRTSDIAGAPVSDDIKQRILQWEVSESRRNALTQAISHCSDAVVGINVVQVRQVRNPWLPSDPLAWMLFDERLLPRTFQQKVQNLGSGFLISPDGYIVTNEHVVRDAAEIVVTTTERKKYVAKVVGTDPLLDVALLKIEAADLPSIPFGNSDSAIVGEWVIAIGNPYGLFDVNDQPSVSVGVISALHRDFASRIDGRIYSDMIQTDAAINRGNSGGPLLDASGEAVGMNSLIFSESGGSVGVGFAIPSKRIVAAIEDLKHGPINRNYWIGIRAGDITPTQARLHGLENASGVIVTMVEPRSPAYKAGVRVEDIILEINGHAIKSAMAAREILDNTDIRVGDQLRLKLSRKGKIMDVLLSLTPIPE